MDIVLLLGAGAEPAQSVARRLVGLGARVYGLAHKFPEQGFAHRDFVPVPVNPADPAAVRAEVERIVAREGAVNTVILAGHNPVDDAFESAHPNDVALAVFAGLAAPLAAVRAAMPGLIRRRGLVAAITRPVFGPGAALGGVVEAGLAAFCDGLFGELRDTGVRVCHLRIQENSGPADPAARYTSAPQSRVQPDIVADALEAVIRLRENNALTRLVLRPQATREEPRIPVTSEPKLASLQAVQLPTSKNYPPAEEKIFTPEYRRPDYAPPPGEGDEEFEDEGDDAVDPELAYLIKPRHRDRFVRDTAEAEPSPDDRGAAPDGAPGAAAPEDASERPREQPRRQEAPQHRQEPRQEQSRYHNPYSPQPPHQDRNRQQRPPRHGALRIQPPNMGDEPRPRGLPAQAPQGERPQPQRPYEQMPRPKGWQGPRLPQGFLSHGRPDGQPPRQDDRRGTRPEFRPRGDRPDRDEPASAEAPPREVAAPAPEASAERPAAQPAPAIVPVETGRQAESVSDEAGDRGGSSRSEAVTLRFPSEKPEAAPSVAPAKPEIADEPSARSAEAPESPARDEAESESPVRVKKRPAAKRPAKAKAPKDESDADAAEKPARPKRKAPPKADDAG